MAGHINSNSIKDNIQQGAFLKKSGITGIGIGVSDSEFAKNVFIKEIRVGVIGLSVHSAAYTEIINSGAGSPEFSSCRVTAIFHPKGNEDVEFSAKQLQSFTETIKGQGVEFVKSTKQLVRKVDAVM
ncbi:MAG: hypothetical protein ABIQ00_24890, partial [Chitinophagaceae bacterium]